MGFRNCLSLGLFLVSLIEASPGLNGKLSQDILNTILSEGTYNKLVRPSETTDVVLSLHLKYINFLDDINMELGTQVTLRLKWLDVRLDYRNFTRNSEQPLLPEYIAISEASRIWYPDIFISNEKNGAIHNILKPNVLLRIHQNGTVLFSTRVTLVTDCQMSLHWYPFDRHRCSVKFSSFALKYNEMSPSWSGPDAVTTPPIGYQLSRFTFLGFSSKTENSNGAEDFPKSIVTLTFRREISYYVSNVFIPTAMLVFVSWISFWFDVTALEARVTLGVTTILTMATQTFGFNQTAPVVSYTKVIDIFAGVSQTFITLALLEFALVDFTLRKYSSCLGSGIFPKHDVGCAERGKSIVFNNENIAVARLRAQRIDNVSRILFPVGYSCFLLLYFAICFGH